MKDYIFANIKNGKTLIISSTMLDLAVTSLIDIEGKKAKYWRFKEAREIVNQSLLC